MVKRPHQQADGQAPMSLLVRRECGNRGELAETTMSEGDDMVDRTTEMHLHRSKIKGTRYR